VDIVGYVFLGVIALVVLIALVFVVVSLPDIARYQRIRRM
jgi:hypothetical protein